MKFEDMIKIAKSIKCKDDEITSNLPELNKERYFTLLKPFGDVTAVAVEAKSNKASDGSKFYKINGDVYYSIIGYKGGSGWGIGKFDKVQTIQFLKQHGAKISNREAAINWKYNRASGFKRRGFDSKVKDAPGKLDAALPELVKLINNNKSEIQKYGKALANGNVSRPNYNNFTTRFAFDVFYALKRKGFDLYKYMDSNDVRDDYIGTLMKKALTQANISVNENDYKVRDSKVKDAFDINKSYWNGHGKFQKELDWLEAHDLHPKHAYQYYRMYNDGDYPTGLGVQPIMLASDWNYIQRSVHSYKEREAAKAKVYEHVEKMLDEEIISLYNKMKPKYNDSKVNDTIKYVFKKGDSISFRNACDYGMNIPLIEGAKKYTFNKDVTFYTKKDIQNYVDSELTSKYNANKRSEWMVDWDELKNFTVKDSKAKDFMGSAAGGFVWWPDEKDFEKDVIVYRDNNGDGKVHKVVVPGASKDAKKVYEYFEKLTAQRRKSFDSKAKDGSFLEEMRKEDEARIAKWGKREAAIWRNTDWKARNYKPMLINNDSFTKDVKVNGLKGTYKILKNVKFVLEISPNTIYAPRYVPLEEYTKYKDYAWVYDGNKKNGYIVIDRADTYELYDLLTK